MEIQTGMVFALETYCPATDGYSAARIEEEVVVTETGVRGYQRSSRLKTCPSPIATDPARGLAAMAEIAETNAEDYHAHVPADGTHPHV